MATFSLLQDASRVPAYCVVLDIFRSSNTIIEILYKGARRIIPVESISEARQLQTIHPDWLLFAERGGKRIEDCDGDNSPVATGRNVAGQTVILTTSGGSRCLVACDDNHEILIGSFMNAAAVLKYLHLQKCGEPGFWAVGQRAEIRVEEDELCARYLDDLWHGNGDSIKIDQLQEKLNSCEGAKRLRALGQQQDLEYCTTFDGRDLVPVRRRFNDQLWCIEK
jgi:2-phosphosulfolactate phosphatase